jgi:hypothetical protein
MFLFEGDFGRILHTGDFRFHPAILEHPVLSPSRGAIDLLYLDTTYNQQCCVLPTREAAFAEVCAVIEAHPEHDIVLGIDNLGKEELLIRLAHRFKSLVVVSPERLRWLRVCELTDVSVFTSEPEAGRFIVEPRRVVTRDRIRTLNHVHPTIGIVASGWASAGRAGAMAVSSSAQRPLLKAVMQQSNSAKSTIDAAKRRRKQTRANKDDDSIDDDDDDDAANGADAAAALLPTPTMAQREMIYRVPYSLHSSFAELTEFVSAVRPKKIVPITATFTDISHFDRYLSPEPSNLRSLASLLAANAPPPDRAAAAASKMRHHRPLSNDRTVRTVGNAIRRALGGMITVNSRGERLAVRLKKRAPETVVVPDSEGPTTMPSVVTIPSSIEDDDVAILNDDNGDDDDAKVLGELIYVNESLDLICSPSVASLSTIVVHDEPKSEADAAAADAKALAFLERVRSPPVVAVPVSPKSEKYEPGASLTCDPPSPPKRRRLRLPATPSAEPSAEPSVTPKATPVRSTVATTTNKSPRSKRKPLFSFMNEKKPVIVIKDE